MENNIEKIIIFILILICISIGFVIGNHYNPMDANKDGIVNSQDYVTIKNYIMKESE